MSIRENSVAMSGYDFKKLWQDPAIWGEGEDGRPSWYIEEMDIAINGRRDPDYVDQLMEDKPYRIPDTAYVVIFGGYFCWQGRGKQGSEGADLVRRASEWIKAQKTTTLGITIEAPNGADFDQIQREIAMIVSKHSGWCVKFAGSKTIENELEKDATTTPNSAHLTSKQKSGP
jgi:hypothetical protein